MTARAPRRDVHVRISRLVIDRAALSGAGADGLRERLTARIAARIADQPADGGPSRSSLSDSIAEAVSARVSPHLTGTGRR
jgi:hypothetical protein